MRTYAEGINGYKSVLGFPEFISDVIIEGLSYWHEGGVEFVSMEEADMIFLPFSSKKDMPYGLSTFPHRNDILVNDLGKFVSVAGINTSFLNSMVEHNFDASRAFAVKLVRHEAGHFFGVDHIEDSARKLMGTWSGACRYSDLSEFVSVRHHGFMYSELSTEELSDIETFYEAGVRRKLGSFAPDL